MTPPDFPPVQQRLMTYVRRHFQPGFNHFQVVKLVGDASMRQYFRYRGGDRESFVLAAYPEPFDPENFNYKQVYDLLTGIEVPVPEILDLDGELGIVLQKDLGNLSLQEHLMTASPRERQARLREAIGHMVTIQRHGSRRVLPGTEAFTSSFDREKLNWEFAFFRRHYLRNYRGLEDRKVEGLEPECSRIAGELSELPRVLCHRDYHVRNLLLFQDRLYLIDFQDARWGPAAYDLASLLKDSCELPAGEVEDYIDYFLERSGRRPDVREFRREFHLMAVQRLLKALGTFGYQVFVRENHIYEQYMPGSLHRALLSLDWLGDFPVLRRLVTSELASR
jgi:aminoglycoside/choline kinase family phosphotransferase